MGQPLRAPVLVPNEPILKRRQYRFRRRHTPHFYLVISALSFATLLCGMDVGAYVNGTVLGAEVAFVWTGITAIVVCAAYFWGFYLLMKGTIAESRLKVLVPHATVGTLSPLLYMLNVSIAFEDFSFRSEAAVSVVVAFFSLALLLVQFRMGRAVARVDPPRLLRMVPGSRS